MNLCLDMKILSQDQQFCFNLERKHWNVTISLSYRSYVTLVHTNKSPSNNIAVKFCWRQIGFKFSGIRLIQRQNRRIHLKNTFKQYHFWVSRLDWVSKVFNYDIKSSCDNKHLILICQNQMILPVKWNGKCYNLSIR